MTAVRPRMQGQELLEQLAAPGGLPAGIPTLVVMAHPDDEVVGLGASLAGMPGVSLVHVTDGAPQDGTDARAAGFSNHNDYAWARREELRCALALAGIAAEQTDSLGYPDQQAALHLASSTRALCARLLRLCPALVLTHPYEGGHPDHDATAFAVHAAARLAAERGVHTEVAEATSYHQGPEGIETGLFLPGNVDGQMGQVVTRRLTAEERERKRRMLDCFRTQQGTLKYFRVDAEHVRLAPRYDFTRPPHSGRLFYEGYPWGMSGERFRALAGAAQGEPGPGLSLDRGLDPGLEPGLERRAESRRCP